LGIVVKRVSGKSLREFAAENIFRPLGMNNTQYRDDQNVVIPNLATGHILNANHELVSLATAYHLVGDGGIYTTAEDLFRWDQNFYNNKLSNKDRHLTDQFYEKGRLNNGDTVDYAFGVVRSQLEGMETIEHGGQFIGYKSDLIRFPAKELSVIVLCNTETIDAQRLSVQVANLYLTKE
jgi:CubicO group peptidase (beta-lactamase class C family)